MMHKYIEMCVLKDVLANHMIHVWEENKIQFLQMTMLIKRLMCKYVNILSKYILYNLAYVVCLQFLIHC
jgi:hypothetical protein